jgi:hypothetical protein
LASAQWSLFRWQLKNGEMEFKKWRRFVNTHCAMANFGKTVFEQFAKAWCIHDSFQK